MGPSRSKNRAASVAPPQLEHPSEWQLASASWVRHRTAEWRSIFSALKPLQYKASEIALLRDYFLEGKLPTTEISWDGQDLISVPLLYRLWLSPDRSERNWSVQAKFTTWSDYYISVRQLFSVCAPVYNNGCDVGDIGGRLYAVLLGPTPEKTFLDSYFDGRERFSTKSILGCYRNPGQTIVELIGVLQSAEAEGEAIARYELPDSLRLLGDQAWLPPRNLSKRQERLAQLFELILDGRRRRRELKGASKAQLAEKDALAVELAAVFDQEVGPIEVQKLWAKAKTAHR